MLNSRRLIMIGLLFLLIGGVGAYFTYPSAADSEQEAEVYYFDEEITAVTVESDTAKIEILQASNDTASVEFDIPAGQKQKYRLQASVEDGVLEVEAKQSVLVFFNFDFNFKSFITRIYLPANMYEAVTASTTNGAITIKDLQASVVEAETTNGRLIFENLETKEVIGETTNGSVHFIETSGELFAETTNGEISLDNEKIEQQIDFETVNGKIEIKVDETPHNAEISANVTNGKVHIFGEDTSFWTFGNGGIRIDLTTTNGGITVNN